MQVNSIKQWPRRLPLIAPYLLLAAMATPRRITEITTRTWIHGRDELKSGWEGDGTIRSANNDTATFEWFAQYIQYFAAVFRQFIEKEYAAMS